MLAVSAIVLSVLVAYNFYNLYSYKVYLISPDKRMLVSTEFPVTIMVKGNKVPSVVEIYVDDKLTDKKLFENIDFTDLREIKLASLSIDPLYLSNGKHNFTVVLKGGFFQKDSRVSAEFLYEKMNSYFRLASDENISGMTKFFAEDVSQLIVRLNNAREYYVNSDWRKSDKYVAVKEKVFSADVDTAVKNRLGTLIYNIEEKSPVDEIYNSLNSLNAELYNKGYPVAGLMFEYRYLNGNSHSFLLSYKITDSVLTGTETRKSKVDIIKRIDDINIKEQFLGIKLPNSPFSFILDESLALIYKRYSDLLGTNFSASAWEIKKLTNGFITDESEVKYLLEKLKEETGAYTRKAPLFQLVKEANAYHEIRHLEDYKNARNIGRSVPQILKYFYGDYQSSGFALDSNFTLEKEICETLLKANPEYSAYLYELSNSRGLRRILLLTLFEKIVNPDKEETSHHWAGKLIINNLAKMNGIDTGELLTEQVKGNEQSWYDLTRKLVDMHYEKIERDASHLLMNEFR